MTRLVLFDIDGTLIRSGRAGVRGMNAAFEGLYGRPAALDGISLAGRTDRAIVTDVLRAIGRDATPEAILELRTAYLQHLAEEIVKPVPDSNVLPGVWPLLDALRADGESVIGLLTGNFEGGAAIKLGHFDLWTRFAFGAYGDEHADRRALVPVAMAAAARVGLNIPLSQVIVIGDTPLDVDCAQVHGARSIAVATGPFSVQQLETARPDLVVETLEDDRVRRFLD